MSLRLQVGIATALLCALVIAVLAIAAAVIGERQARASAQRQLTDVAFTLSDRLDRSLNQRMGTLSLIATLPRLRSVWFGNAPDMRTVLTQTKDYIAGASWLGYASADGTVLAASGGLLEGKSVAERPWFKSGLKGPTFEDVHEAKLLAPLLGPSPDGQPFRFVDVAMPLRNPNGEALGVLGLHIGWNWVADIRTALLESHTGAEGLDLWIVSKEGVVLLGPNLGETVISPEQLASLGSEARGSFTETYGGEERLMGFSRLESIERLGWYVVANQPTRAAFAPARTLVLTIVSVGLFIAVFAFIGASIIAGRVSRPLSRLTEEADRIGRDSLDMLPRMRGTAEVVRLSSALRSLILRIGKAQRETQAVEVRAADEARRLESDIASLRSIVDIDPLSGILNRRGFMAFAEDAMMHFRRYGRQFAILMIDIDHFKRVNDTHGHAAGDAAIRVVAEAIETAIRPSDKAGRFGGEEFVVLLHEIAGDDLEETAERVRSAVASSPVKLNGVELLVTVSVGVSVAEVRDRDVNDLIERADLALYTAKNAGRNRVSIAPPSPPAEERLSA